MIRIGFFLCLIIPFHSYSGVGSSNINNPEQSAMPTVQHVHIKVPKEGANIHITNEPHFNNQNQQSGSMENSNLNANKNELFSVSQLYNTAQAHFSNFLQQHNIQIQQFSPRELAGNAKLYTFANKKKVAFSLFALVYGSASVSLIAGNYYLNKPSNWSFWKKHLSIEELHEYPQHDLQKNLREAILHRYLNSTTKSSLTSYMQFINAIDKEERLIKRYLSVAHLVKKSRLMRLFPVNDNKIKRVKEKKQRLAFIKHIFISWAAQQNFEKV